MSWEVELMMMIVTNTMAWDALDITMEVTCEAVFKSGWSFNHGRHCRATSEATSNSSMDGRVSEPRCLKGAEAASGGYDGAAKAPGPIAAPMSFSDSIYRMRNRSRGTLALFLRSKA